MARFQTPLIYAPVLPFDRRQTFTIRMRKSFRAESVVKAKTIAKCLKNFTIPILFSY